MRDFVVIKSTASKNGGFINTLEHNAVVKVFGATKTVKQRVLLKTDTELSKDQTDKLDLSQFDIVPRTSVVEVDGVGRVINSNWLQLKVNHTMEEVEA